jgi:hypothetical protein
MSFFGSGMFLSAPGGGGPLFRALDKATATTLPEMRLAANETGIAMTYPGNRAAVTSWWRLGVGTSRQSCWAFDAAVIVKEV